MESDDDYDTSGPGFTPRKRDTRRKYEEDHTGADNLTFRNIIEVGNFPTLRAMRSIAREGLLLVAECEPSNGLRSLCTVSHILEDWPPQANPGAWGVSLEKWHHILKADLAYHDTAEFDITCKVLGEPLLITTDRHLAVALSACEGDKQPVAIFVLTPVGKKSEDDRKTREDDKRLSPVVVPFTGDVQSDTSGKRRKHSDDSKAGGSSQARRIRLSEDSMSTFFIRPMTLNLKTPMKETPL